MTEALDRGELERAATIARALALEAGRRARAAFARPKRVAVKGRGNLVTDTDRAIEEYLRAELAAAFPGYGLLGEEDGGELGDGPTWVVDPLDGTRNFTAGIPFFAVSIGLVVDHGPVVGVVHAPMQDETWQAVRGAGASLNGDPVRASTADRLDTCIVGVDLGYSPVRAGFMLDLATALWPDVQAFRIPGSACLGLVYAACGRYDLFVHHLLYPWDLAAGLCILQEAGATAWDRDGNRATITGESVIAGAPRAAARLLERVRGLPWRD